MRYVNHFTHCAMFEGLNEADVQSAVDAAQPATMKPQQYAAMLREVFAVVLVKWPRVKNIDGLFLGGPPGKGGKIPFSFGTLD